MNFITRSSPEPIRDDVFYKRLQDILLEPSGRGNQPSQASKLMSHVYIGNQTNAEDLRLLRRLGITHVLNCAGYKGYRPVPNASPYEGLGIDYYEFKAEDRDTYDITAHFYEAFQFLDGVERRGGVALVHCCLGVNRSAAICMAYLMGKTTMTLLKAAKVMKEKRGLLLSNSGFQRQLVKFARRRGLLDKHVIPDAYDMQRRRSVDLREQRRSSLSSLDYRDHHVSFVTREPSAIPSARYRSSSVTRYTPSFAVPSSQIIGRPTDNLYVYSKAFSGPEHVYNAHVVRSTARAPSRERMDPRLLPLPPTRSRRTVTRDRVYY